MPIPVLKAIQRLLMLGCAYLLYSAVVPLVEANPVPETLREVAAAPQGALAFERYAVIAERNLFNTPAVGVPLRNLEELEESELRLRLLGTVSLTLPGLSVASVEDLTKRQKLAVRVGDTISGARVIRIERERLVVDNQGRLEQISLDEQAQPSPWRSASP